MKISNHNNQLSEGLRTGDLEKLVRDELSIDQFVPKLDPDNIVVTFFVLREPAAKDLHSFIDHGPIDTLDSETSSTPDDNGFYAVFCEFERNSEFPEKLIGILKNLKYIAGIEKWRFIAPKVKSSIELNAKSLQSCIRLAPKEEENQVKETILELLKDSDVDTIKMEGRILKLSRQGTDWNFMVEGIVPNITSEAHMDLTFHGVSECRRLERFLGTNKMFANKVGESFVITNGEKSVRLTPQ